MWAGWTSTCQQEQMFWFVVGGTYSTVVTLLLMSLTYMHFLQLACITAIHCTVDNEQLLLYMQHICVASFAQPCMNRMCAIYSFVLCVCLFVQYMMRAGGCSSCTVQYEDDRCMHIYTID